MLRNTQLPIDLSFRPRPQSDFFVMSETEKHIETISKQGSKGLEHIEQVDTTDSLGRTQLGHDATELRGYWQSFRFIGSLVAVVVTANTLFLGYSIPVSTWDRSEMKSSSHTLILLRSI